MSTSSNCQKRLGIHAMPSTQANDIARLAEELHISRAEALQADLAHARVEAKALGVRTVVTALNARRSRSR